MIDLQEASPQEGEKPVKAKEDQKPNWQ